MAKWRGIRQKREGSKKRIMLNFRVSENLYHTINELALQPPYNGNRSWFLNHAMEELLLKDNNKE